MQHEDSTELLMPDATGIQRAAALLRDGELVAFPTETVYGLGADATSADATAAVFEVKGRPRQNPLIVHVSGWADAAAFVEPNPLAELLAGRWWPGPLTVVVRCREGSALATNVTGGQGTVAMRAPEHSVARELLEQFGGPLVGPSANLSGHVSATTAAHVMADLQGRIAAVIDGGPCPLGIESTIVDCTTGRPIVLRQGMVGLADLTAESGVEFELSRVDTERSPGSFPSHYAPRAAMRLNADAPRAGEGWLGFGADTGAAAAAVALSLSADGDLQEAAHNLYSCLRQLDERLGGQGTIAVSPIPETGVGLTINDRLRRAAAPREP